MTRLKLLKFFQYRRLQVFDLSFEPFCLSDVHKWKFLFEKKFQNISKCTNGSTNAPQRCIQCYLSPFHPFFLQTAQLRLLFAQRKLYLKTNNLKQWNSPSCLLFILYKVRISNIHRIYDLFIILYCSYTIFLLIRYGLKTI